MVENSIIFKTETSFYNMAYSLVSLAHIPPLKTEKQNAPFAPSMILYVLFSFTLPCHQNFGLKLYALPHICSTFILPNQTQTPLPTTPFLSAIPIIPSFVSLVVYVFPIPTLPPPINFLLVLFLAFFLAILMNTRAIVV
jgi:hypothetical protein